MPKIPLTSLKGHRYAGKWQRPGAQYQADGQTHARLMVALGNASPTQPAAAPAPAADPAAGTYSTRDQLAENSPPQAGRRAAAKRAAAKSTGYRRRDQVADQE